MGEGLCDTEQLERLTALPDGARLRKIMAYEVHLTRQITKLLGELREMQKYRSHRSDDDDRPGRVFVWNTSKPGDVASELTDQRTNPQLQVISCHTSRDHFPAHVWPDIKTPGLTQMPSRSDRPCRECESTRFHQEGRDPKRE